MKKILIVGGVAGGASAAARLRRHSEEDQIIMFERGPHVSFSNCCLPYHLSGVIETADKLVLMTPEKFAKRYKIDARTSSEVLKIDREKKELTVKNLETGEEYQESYDKLILSPGAKPIMPRIPGIENVNTFAIRNVVDIDRLKKFVDKMDNKNVTVIGGGFIGVEATENLKEAGYNVTLVEAAPQIMRIFDYDMVQILHKELHDQGVNLIVGDKVDSFKKDTVVLESGKEINAGAVVLAIGVLPETDLAKEAGLELGKTGAIKTNQNWLTNDKDIYAVGDAIQVYNALTNDYQKLPLAGPAQKQARGVADHINGMRIDNRGYIGSSVIKAFNYNGASTGLTESMIEHANLSLNYDTVELIPGDSVGIMPTSSPLHIKLVYEVPTGRVLGAQAIGKGDAAKRIDVIATVIKLGGTIFDLKDLELCYAPPFGTAKDAMNFAGYIATNLLNDDYKQVHFREVREIIENGGFVVDLREEDEYGRGHLNAAKNIPMSQIRERLDEIPTDKPVYLHCRSGERSYNICRMLGSLGYDNIFNVSGGFMGICFYEYFNDQVTDREALVSKYNFNK